MKYLQVPTRAAKEEKRTAHDGKRQPRPPKKTNEENPRQETSQRPVMAILGNTSQEHTASREQIQDQKKPGEEAPPGIIITPTAQEGDAGKDLGKHHNRLKENTWKTQEKATND